MKKSNKNQKVRQIDPLDWITAGSMLILFAIYLLAEALR